jgi:hypothetical protein
LCRLRVFHFSLFVSRFQLRFPLPASRFPPTASPVTASYLLILEQDRQRFAPGTELPRACKHRL